MRALIAPFANRPRMLGAVAIGLATALALRFIPNEFQWSTRAILAWDAGLAWFISACLVLMAGQQAKDIRERAAGQDEGRHMILALVTLATVAALGTIALELSMAQHEHGLRRALHVGLGLVTVAGSWFMTQLVYALHYAHEYYGAVEGHARSVRGGLKFPGDGAPDYWDFLHFSIVIGVASQTADIAFTSKPLRRIGTVHSVFAFVFNTAVLALTINLVAGLF